MLGASCVHEAAIAATCISHVYVCWPEELEHFGARSVTNICNPVAILKQ